MVIRDREDGQGHIVYRGVSPASTVAILSHTPYIKESCK